MRACTAVVTEISYNFETADRYRAEINFIDKRTWQRELGIMLGELQEEEGVFVNSRELAKATEKIRVVYPK